MCPSPGVSPPDPYPMQDGCSRNWLALLLQDPPEELLVESLTTPYWQRDDGLRCAIRDARGVSAQRGRRGDLRALRLPHRVLRA